MPSGRVGVYVNECYMYADEVIEVRDGKTMIRALRVCMRAKGAMGGRIQWKPRTENDNRRDVRTRWEHDRIGIGVME